MSKIKVNELDTRSGTTITVAAGKTLAGTDIIDTTQIAADAITATELANNAVDTNAIADDQVTLAKLADGTQGGTLYYGAAGAPTQLAAGTSGYFLKTQGVGANPVWGGVTEYDDSAILNDIATLALHSATQNNQTAFNLTNAFVDQYEDDTGIDTETNTDRNATGEYVSSIVPDTDTILYLDMDGANAGTTFTDGSESAHTITVQGAAAYTSTAQKKWGTASLYTEGTSCIYVAGSNNATDSNDYFNFGTRDYTIECWVRSNTTGNNEEYIFSKWGSGVSQTDPYWVQFTRSNDSIGYNVQMPASVANHYIVTSTSFWSVNTWYWIAVAREGSTTSFWVDGTRVGTVTDSDAISTHANPYFTIGAGYSTSSGPSYVHQGYIDDFRVSSVARYSGASITVPTAALGAGTVNATGNYTSTTQTALGTVSKASIVVLYKNAYGTATLDTDLVAQVSADGGSNYTAAPLTPAGTFSTGILMAKSNDITIGTTGTAPKYKISFANQAEGSKETRVYGVSLQY